MTMHDEFDWVQDWQDIDWLIHNELGRVLSSNEGNEIDDTQEGEEENC